MADLKNNNGIVAARDKHDIQYNFADQVWPTISTRVEPYYENLIDEDQAFASYEEPNEIFDGNPMLEQYPLQFSQPRTRYHLHSQFCDATWIQQYYQPFIEINPIDFEARGLEADDIVEVFNDRGSFRCRVRASEVVRPATARMYEGMWSKYMVDGNIQYVTNDTRNPRGYKLDYGPVVPFNDTLIEIKKVGDA